MDTSITESLNGFLATHDLVEDPTLALERWAIAIFVGIVAYLLFTGLREGFEWRLRAGVSSLGAAALALAVTHFISLAVDRSRPFVAHPDAIHTFAKHSADAGFPSDHATAAFAIGTAIFLRNKLWGGVVLLLASAVSLGRVALGVHYPSDVIGGAVIGASAALLLWLPPVRTRLDSIADDLGRRIRSMARPDHRLAPQ